MTRDFYERSVHDVARDLVGCTVRRGDTAGRIVEVESYHEEEPACHAFVGLTARTRVLLGPPGRAYVYFSYGIHSLLNAVCEDEGVGAAVLIRALEPIAGIDTMRARRGKQPLCAGPARLCEALGVTGALNGASLQRGLLRIVEGRKPPRREIATGPRIGITQATDWPLRFYLEGSPWVSR